MILFYLILGKSHQEIAELLNLARITITKIIDDKIGIQFGFSGGATQLLVDKAINCGFHRFIPRSLIMGLSMFGYYNVVLDK